MPKLNAHQTAVAAECTNLSIQGRITFPEVVERLAAAGIERYEVDLVRREKRIYDAAGASLLEAPELPELPPVGAEFSAVEVVDAIRSSQQGRCSYLEFLQRILRAGTVGYAVFIKGRRAIYTGREGDFHVERFPAPAEA